MPIMPWDAVLLPPVAGRSQKPRRTGWTMVIDKGLGPSATDDLIALAAPYIDLVKLTFGTSFFYTRQQLVKKIALLKKNDIGVMPGGTLGEVAQIQGKWPIYVERLVELGFDCVEISDGTISLGDADRDRAIEIALDAGLRVVTEIGKKNPADELDPARQIGRALADLAAGAAMVIVEGRESGRDAGIYGKSGEIRADRLEIIAGRLPPARTIWEAPQKSQQEELILRFGPDANLGNIPPADALALEALRIGLRGDTLRAVLQRSG
ncbi:MAG: phosphosulfolactate synthase [Patescibacteria group bacterium]